MCLNNSIKKVSHVTGSRRLNCYNQREWCMIIKVTIKQLGKKRNKITDVLFSLENIPLTLRELIEEAVYTCVIEYNRNVMQKEEVRPLSEEEIENMSEIGKIAFGINYGGKVADRDVAVRVAIEAFEDGLVRIFHNEEELKEPDQEIMVKEGDRFTFIRLTFLSGRVF